MKELSKEYLITRGKYNMLDVLEIGTLKYVKTLDTKGCGVFSSISHLETQRAYTGCYEGNIFTIDLENLSILKDGGTSKLKQGIYDMVILPNSDRILVCAQHFGYLEFVSTENDKLTVLEGGV